MSLHIMGCRLPVFMRAVKWWKSVSGWCRPVWDWWKKGLSAWSPTGQDIRLGSSAALLTLVKSAVLCLTSTFLDIPASLRRMLIKMSLAMRRPTWGFSSAGSGHSGRSIQFFIRSAKLLSPRTRGCLFLLRLSSEVVQSSGLLASNAVQRSRQASEVDLGRILPEAPLFVRRQAEEETLTFLVLLSTTPSSCQEASEYPESKSRLFSLLGEPCVSRSCSWCSSSSSRGLARQQAESYVLASLESETRRRASLSCCALCLQSRVTAKERAHGSLSGLGLLICFRSCRDLIMHCIWSRRQSGESPKHSYTIKRHKELVVMEKLAKYI